MEKFSERYLIPALEQLREDLPFVILGFHSDNGSEYINKRVAGLLEKLRIEFTECRSRQTNDNALAESRNGHEILDAIAYETSDNEAADKLPEARRQLFKSIHERGNMRA